MTRTLTLVRTLFCLSIFVFLSSSQALAVSGAPQSPLTQPTPFFGQITPPPPFQNLRGQYGGLLPSQTFTGKSGLISFANNLLKLIIGVAGLFAFFNIIIAGYTFMSAGGDPKKVEQAWAKIWQSLLGLLFVAGSFVLAAIFGWLIFGDASAILVPKIYGP